MPFEILNFTEATLTSFTGRTETHGKAKVPALSFRLRFSGPNTLLDLLSPTARKTFYAAAEGQEDLPGVDPTTPHLRSRDIKRWQPEASYEGWTVTIDRTGNPDEVIEAGLCKVDAFDCELHDDPGMVDIECRVGTSNVTPEQAGWLWSMQQQKVFVMLAAPLTTETNPELGHADPDDGPQLTLDGTTGAEIGEPSEARLAAEAAFGDPDESDSEGGELDATDAFIEAHGEPERGENWPFPHAPGEEPEGYAEAIEPADEAEAPAAPRKALAAQAASTRAGEPTSASNDQ